MGCQDQDKYSKVDNVQVVYLPDGCVVHKHDPDRVIFLNVTAAFVLGLCNGTNSVREIGERVSQIYNLPNVPDQDMNSCISSLLAEGLIVKRDDQGQSVVSRVRSFLGRAFNVA